MKLTEITDDLNVVLRLSPGDESKISQQIADALLEDQPSRMLTRNAIHGRLKTVFKPSFRRKLQITSRERYPDPENIRGWFHPELTRAGPPEIDLDDDEPLVEYREVYEHLVINGLIGRTLSYFDGVEISHDTEGLIPATWSRKEICLWKSAAEQKVGFPEGYVPYLMEGAQQWGVGWKCLGEKVRPERIIIALLPKEPPG